MAKPTNLDEYFQKMLVLRDQLKAFNNELVSGGTDLLGVTEDDLAGWGLDESRRAYEKARLDAARSVLGALGEFDEASV